MGTSKMKVAPKLWDSPWTHQVANTRTPDIVRSHKLSQIMAILTGTCNRGARYQDAIGYQVLANH